MARRAITCALLLAVLATPALAGQVPGPASAPDVPIGPRDRLYSADQTSNTVSVYEPGSQRLLGVIRLGDTVPQNLSPLYRGQLLVHGLALSPDRRTLAVVSIGSNSVSFIDTGTHRVRHTAYLGRAPHEAFFTPDGGELWVTVRGEDYVAVLDARTYREKRRIVVADGPGMAVFRPDGRYAFVCSSFTPELAAIDPRTYQTVAIVRQLSPFCPNLAATPDGRQVWLTLKDTGKTQILSAEPPFSTLAVLDTGPITNHVNFVRNARGQFAYVTVGGENTVKVFTTDDTPRPVATIPVGALPHGLWPSADGTRLYVGLEHANAIAVVDTLANRVTATIPGGQSPQAIVYAPGAAGDPGEGAALETLTPVPGVLLALGPPGSSARRPATTVAVNPQGLLDHLQAAVSGLEPGRTYRLALAERPSEPFGRLQPLALFKTNPAGAAIVAALGPLKTLLGEGDDPLPRRYLVIVPSEGGEAAKPVQVQLPPPGLP